MTDDRREDEGGAASAERGKAASTVSALMDERRRFEAWLAALDAKRASTPGHVFERVHLDYSTRLDAVVQQLTTHGDALRQEIESLSTRLTALRAEEQAAADERAEAELRAHVGELSTEAWSSTSAASDARLGDIAGRRNVLESELARTTELLNETQRPATPPAAAESVAPEPVSERTAPRESKPAAVSDSAEGDMHVPVAAPAPRASVPQAQPAAADQHRLAIEDTRRNPTPPRANSFDELAFLSSVVDTPSGSLDSAPRDEPDEDTKLQKFARNSVEDAVVSSPETMTPPRQLAAIEIVRDEEPPVPVSASAESGKSLKCGECGAMNYPTEWYCERCGAELASL